MKHDYKPWPSKISDNKRLIFNFYETYKTSIDRISTTDLSKITSLFCAEECGYHIDNTFMDALCGYRNIVEIVISDTEHHLTRLPSWYLGNLKKLFICNDRNVTITDLDLVYMPELESIELSHNTSITDFGLSLCPKLKDIKLYAREEE